MKVSSQVFIVISLKIDARLLYPFSKMIIVDSSTLSVTLEKLSLPATVVSASYSQKWIKMTYTLHQNEFL